MNIRIRYQWAWYCISISLLLILLTSHELISRAESNIGITGLLNLTSSTKSFASNLEFVQELLHSAQSWDSTNPSIARGMGFVHWYRKEDYLALQQWQTLGYTSIDYVAYARQAITETVALRWYQLAEQVEPISSQLWFDIGRICQQKPSSSDMCKRFFQINQANWFVDPFFEFNHNAWSFNGREGVTYNIVECPNLFQHKCAETQINNHILQQSASWQQCFYLKANQTYIYSAWIKVELSYDGYWRPLYFQGVLNGENKGSWPGDEEKSSDWQYWERTFVAPSFDEERACFYPVVLFGSGQAWFHNASLHFRID